MAMNATITVESSEFIQVGDVAFISGAWTITAEGPDGPVNVAGTSADVVRRQSDGSWLFVIDYPNGVK
jgi:ketosteroid isomerase-like protein